MYQDKIDVSVNRVKDFYEIAEKLKLDIKVEQPLNDSFVEHLTQIHAAEEDEESFESEDEPDQLGDASINQSVAYSFHDFLENVGANSSSVDNFNYLPNDTTSNHDTSSIHDVAAAIKEVKKARLSIYNYTKRYQMRSRRTTFYGAIFFCRFCPKVAFHHKRGRLIHEITCSFNPNSRGYFQCDACNKSYLWKKSLENHMRKKHLNEE
jgi:hypothetical protein